MIKACELTRNGIVSINGAPYIVEELKISTPSARGAASIFRFRLRNLITKAKLDQACHGDDKFEELDFEKRQVQFLYKEQGNAYAFMDTADYSQFSLTADELGEQVYYLLEDMDDIRALVVNGTPVAIELPPNVVLEIADCEPTMKGQTVTARTKTATLQTGLSVQVPEYITPGEKVKIDTRTGEFLGRA
ncbi:MAG: elongation factor P [Kiritimatiellae bacterium]|nr:elongation factor P [Kiritimatiellia bacterium]MBR4613339.1 elongation factor P [Kiritimatiellia bacterium]